MAKVEAPSTQEHLPIAGIQDGTVIMTDGSIRVILRIEPINFDLKSEAEQNAIIYGYQGFLNSLDFPIQIVVQSKKLDLERYLLRLESSQKDVSNDLLRIQVEDYVGFVRRLITVANIMSKRFYVSISYSAVTKQTGISQISSLIHRQPTGPVMDQDQFTRFRAEANNRAGIIAAGLGRVGVKCRLVETQELIELFYGIYNPDVATEQRLTTDVSELSQGVINGPGVIDPSAADAPTPPAEPMVAPIPTPVPETPSSSPLAEPLPAPVPIQVPAEQAPPATPVAPVAPMSTGSPLPPPAPSAPDQPQA